MSTQSPFGGRVARTYPTLPKGETIASFETYGEAQAAVDTLAKASFSVKELAIVGTDLTSVERITGTLSWGRAAGAGALSGAWFGTFLGLLFFIFSPTGAGLGILISAVLIGAGFGMIFSVVSYSLNRRRRDFTSVAQVLATRYAIITEAAHADRARSVLGVTDAPAPAPPAAPQAAPEPDTQPPAYGEKAESGEAAVSGSADADADSGADEPRGLTYGEAQDAARRAARERRDSDAGA
ncbi:MAG TPA: general stress protein [Agromyces sp.]|nr:general stress protein [Agromyces sp.]